MKKFTRNLSENTIFNVLLLLTILGEFLLPWVLKHFYAGYDSKKMVMSVLGSPESPVRNIYNVWLIWLGIFLIITSITIFLDIKTTSFPLAALTFFSIIVFAVGAGILAGIFSVNESKEIVTAASQIHGAGAAIGFMTLLFFPLLSGIAALKQNDVIFGIICMLSFFLALIFFILFIMGDKEQFRNTLLAYEGMWERAALLAMYIPFICRAITNLYQNVKQ